MRVRRSCWAVVIQGVVGVLAARVELKAMARTKTADLMVFIIMRILDLKNYILN